MVDPFVRIDIHERHRLLVATSSLWDLGRDGMSERAIQRR